MRRGHVTVSILSLTIISILVLVTAYQFPPMFHKQDDVIFAVALQPLPNGEVKVLAKGSIGDVKRAKGLESEWEKYLEKDRNVLKSTPTPIVIYFKKNKIGVGSLKNGRLISKAERVIEKLQVTPERESNKDIAYASECPKGFIQISDRYCIANEDPIVYGGNARTKIVSEWVPFMGVEVLTSSKPINAISPSWGLQLDRTAVAVYSLDFGGIPLATLGSEYQGETLKVTYGPEGEGVLTDGGYVERYINLPIKYLVFMAELRGYDRYAQKYVYIPLTGAYPLEILLTGEYNLTEKEINKEITSSEGLEGCLLTDHRIERYFPIDAKDKVKLIKTNSNGYYANIIFQFQGGRSSDFYSFPIGGLGQAWLSSIRGRTTPISLIISYSYDSMSFVTYSIDIINAPPNTKYEVRIKKRNLTLPSEGGPVEIGMYFTKIIQAEEDPHPVPPCINGICPNKEH